MAMAAALFLAEGTGLAAFQQPADRPAAIDTYVEAQMKRFHVPGLALAIVRNGEFLYAKGYGFANLEHQVPVKTETVFQSGSTGKQYTSMAVMILAEEGKIKLEDGIRTVFPDAPDSWQPITIRHLLTHTSGLGDYTPAFDLRKDMKEEELRRLIYGTPLGFKPGERFRYSNLGYALLGTLISRVSGKFYGDFLRERIFEPLGMATARIINERDIVPNRAAGYLWRSTAWKNQEWVSPTFNSTADGSLYLTLADVAKWDAALSTEKLVRRASLDQAFTSGKLNDGKETG
jgi:CubicO group peptidase (beta-lactamase class C family)